MGEGGADLHFACLYDTGCQYLDRWKKILEIKDLFEKQIDCSIYSLLPGVVENSFC